MKDKKLIKETEKNQEIIQFMSETITNFEDFYKKTDSSEFNPIISINQTLKILDSTLTLNQIKLNKKIDSKIKIFGNANSLAHVVLSIIQNINDVMQIRKPKSPTVNISLKDKKSILF